MSVKVYGQIKDISRFSRVVTGTVSLINGPISEDPFLVTTTEVTFQTNSSGYFEILSLGKGDYQMLIGQDKIFFSVTEDTGEFNIISLITGDLTYTKQPYTSNWNGIRIGAVQFIYVPEPPDMADVGSGLPNEITLTSNDNPTELEDDVVYSYWVSYVSSQGESRLSGRVQVDSDGNLVSQYPVSADAWDASMNPTGGPYKGIVIPLEVNPPNVIKKRIWRTKVDGNSVSSLDYVPYLLVELDPSVASYEDRESMAHFANRLDESIRPVDENITAGRIFADNQELARFSRSNNPAIGNGLTMLSTLRLKGTFGGFLENEFAIGADGKLYWKKNGIIRRLDNEHRIAFNFDRSDIVKADDWIGGVVCLDNTDGAGYSAFQLMSATIMCRNRPRSGVCKIAIHVTDGVSALGSLNGPLDPASTIVSTPGHTNDLIFNLTPGTGTPFNGGFQSQIIFFDLKKRSDGPGEPSANFIYGCGQQIRFRVLDSDDYTAIGSSDALPADDDWPGGISIVLHALAFDPLKGAGF